MVSFITYIGLKARGMKDTLVLHKRDKDLSYTVRKGNGRACPPPLNKAEWQDIAQRHVPDPAMIILHTDGVKCYGGATPHHTRVVHSGPDPVHVQPQMAGNVEVIAGTQSLDATWGALKSRLRHTNRDDGSFDDAVRFATFAKFLHWTQGKDRWIELFPVLIHFAASL
eukprot:5904911-Amphidinium_carterae.1